MKVKTDFGTYEVICQTAKYIHGDNLCISLVDAEDYSPFARLTVNLDGQHLKESEAFVDINNCPWAEEFIAENGLGIFTGDVGTSGFCSYPLYSFDMEKLNN